MRSTFKMLGTYICRCLAFTLRGSLASALNWAGIIGVGVVGAYFEKRGSPMIDLHTWKEIVIWTIVYTATAWVFIFIVRLVFVAPFQTFQETEKERIQLKSALDDRALRQRALNSLWDLRESGVQIRNTFPKKFSKWNAQYENWRRESLNAAGVLSINLRRHLETLNETHGFPSNIKLIRGKHRKEHHLGLRVISEILRRLEKYLEKDL